MKHAILKLFILIVNIKFYQSDFSFYYKNNAFVYDYQSVKLITFAVEMKTIKQIYNLLTAIFFVVLFLGACPDPMDTNQNEIVSQTTNNNGFQWVDGLDLRDSSHQHQKTDSHFGFHQVEIDSFVPQTFTSLGVPFLLKIELSNFHYIYIPAICLNINPLPPSLV